MSNILTLSGMLDSLVPISRFNKGEANKIFDEVRESGCKIVVKNNIPACVMLAPEKYKEMIDMIEDVYLLNLAEERLNRDSKSTYPAEDVYNELGIESDDQNAIPMEYGVDFD